MIEIADLLGFGAGDQQKTPFAASWFVQGVVSENGNDQFPAMVKVEFTAWEQGKSISDWIPVLRPYGGSDYGAYVIPEIGETVLVGFIGGAANKPFVLGSLHPVGSQQVKERYDKDNTNKVFSTKGGVAIAVSDIKDKQSVQVTTPKGLSLTLEDEKETMTLQDKQGKNLLQIDAKGGKLTIKADSTLTLQSGSCKLVIDGKKNAVTIESGTLEVKAKQQAKVEATGTVQLSGGMMKVEGKQTLALKGGAMAELSGGIVKIN